MTDAANPSFALATPSSGVLSVSGVLSFDTAAEALQAQFTPLSDMRASNTYRMTTAQNLLRRFWLETRPGAPLLRTAVNAYACRA